MEIDPDNVVEEGNTENATKKEPSLINGITIDEFVKNGYAQILEATKGVNAIPSGASRSLYSAYPAFSHVINTTSEKILGIISDVIKLQDIKGNIQRRDNDEKFELLLECNDVMLERINSNLDDMAGIKKNPETVLVQTEIQTPAEIVAPVSGSWNDKRTIDDASAIKMKTTKLLTARNIVRPQANFKVPVDNSNANPFEPRLRDKPNSLKPLAILPEYDDDGNIVSYLHPYEMELTKFEPDQRQLKVVTARQPAKLADTELIHVDTEWKLNELLDDLRTVSEFAVDLEHHSYRTFLGITCLMQISTRTRDYIIDTLALREELHVLNEVFTNPKIVKVFHGADSDVEWLQRDLSLYLVNVFDTHQAAKRLNLARLSLAFLLKQYCQLDVDKTFQLADWRIRPLPEELIKYARQDTHYLLYVFDTMTNDLLAAANGQTNLLKSVYQTSTEICKKRYIKPRIFSDSYVDLYSKSKRIFDNRQLYALNALFAWRDKIARQEDESYGFVLPNHMMLQIAEILPREMQGILACCNPIPPLVRQNLPNLHQFVLKARDQPLIKPIIEEQTANRGAILTKSQDLTGHLFCPHDLSHNTEFRDDLPTLIGQQQQQQQSLDGSTFKSKLIKNSTISVFDTPGNSSEDEASVSEKLKKINQIKFVSPFARYLAILPLAEKQRHEEQARLDQENKKKKLCPEKTENLEEYVVVIKREPAAFDQANHTPLKDYGKRKRNNDYMVASTSSTTTVDTTVGTPATLQQAKRMRFDVNSSTSQEQHLASSSSAAVSSEQDEIQPATAEAAAPGGFKNKKNKKFINNKTAQSSTTPVRFDYSQVDFKKFQGGSHKHKSTANDVSTKFHGKNKNKRGNDKKFNKLLTFSKVNKK